MFVALFLAVAYPLPHLFGGWLGHPADFPRPPIPDDSRMTSIQPGLTGYQPNDHLPQFNFSLDDFRRHLYLFFTAVFFSFLLRTREHVSRLTEDKLSAELSSLKAQINPHFLFNTLNTIYALSIKKDDKASEAIVHLSGLMRYVTRDIKDDAISLEKEVEYITHYIELQRARLGNTTDILFDVTGTPTRKKISSLILITYIENAFKYGVNPDVEGCVVKIQLAINDSGIHLLTFNRKVPKVSETESTGIGIKNTNERLKYLYPQKHRLEIQEYDATYSVNLSIDLT